MLFLALPVKIYSEDDYNSARLVTLYGGGMLPLNFNSMKKIKNGIEIDMATKFGIAMVSNNVLGHDLTGFELNFNTFNGQAEISGESAANSLPLNMIRVKAENVMGLETGVSEGYQDLTTGFVNLFSYTNTPWSDLAWDTHQLKISVECGKTNGTMLGRDADYYSVEIEFELIPTGSGF